MTVTICDVAPRDGLQNEPQVVPPAQRAELVNRLAVAGVPRIEAASFVNPKRVPQMAGAEEIAAAIERREGTEYSGLALNERGYERLRASGLDRVNFTLAATEAFNLRNGNQSLEQARAAAESVLARSEVPVTLTISVAFGCPFEGPVDPGRVLELAALPAGEIVLADTIGVATPRQVRSLVEQTLALGKRVGFHGHDTRHTGVANALAAVEAGASVLDASVGGIGGCPYAPKATGNVATDDLVYALEGEGVATGVDLDALIRVAEWLAGILGRALPGRVYRAGPFVPTGLSPASTA